MDGPGHFLGFLWRGHPRCRHPDGRRLGLRSLEFWRLLGLGSGRKQFAGALAGLGRWRSLVAHQQIQTGHRHHRHLFAGQSVLLVGGLQHLPDQEWHPRRHLGAQFCRQRHSAPIAGFPLGVLRPLLHPAAGTGARPDFVWRIAGCHDGGHCRARSCTVRVGTHRRHVGRRPARPLAAPAAHRQGKPVVDPGVLDVCGRHADVCLCGAHHLSDQPAGIEPLLGALQCWIRTASPSHR